jgi:N-acetylmuramoyl-L-alanine amidase
VVEQVHVSGPLAIVDVAGFDPGTSVTPDDLLAMLSGSLDASSGIDSVTLRVLHDGQFVPASVYYAPDPGLFASLIRTGQDNLGIWRSGPPPPRHWPATGSLIGTRIFISPGHGWTWLGASWGTQRGLVNGVWEDYSNAETVNEYLIPMLERMGATVFSCRERGRATEEVIVDNDSGDGSYEEWGTCWRDGSSAGHLGTYRACESTPEAAGEARFTFSVTRGDVHPVYMRWVAGANRNQATPVTITHAGGQTSLTVNQQAEDDRWSYLGGFYFHAGETYEIRITNEGPAGTFVIADGVRIGGGMGEIAPGGSASGYGKWEEAGKYWIQYVGAPASVYDQSAPDEQYSDHHARPGYAEWEGGDAYLMWHSNAFDGTARGTVSFIHASSPSPGSDALATALHSSLISDIHTLFDPEWYDRGRRTGDYIELGDIDTMPAVLLELAFHDNETDAAYLMDPDFRFHVSRAMARGFGLYFTPEAPAPPLPPVDLTAENLGGGSVRISWRPATDPAAPDTPVDRYRIYASMDGRGFDNGEVTATDTSIVIDGLGYPANHFFVVTAENSAGESMPTETLAVRTSWPATTSPILLVGGFDRLDRWVREFDNTRDFVIQYANAIAASADGSYSFDFATNEAVTASTIPLASYTAVIWFTGEESAGDESFSGVERDLIAAYLAGGGAMFITGSEIGWDLDEMGEASTRAWLADSLHVSYEADDADLYTAAPAAGIFDGLDPLSFDPAGGAPYDADFPDVISGSGGSTIDIEYTAGSGASIEYDGADGRLVFWGFPFETVTTATSRAAYMERILLFLVPDVPIPPEPDIEQTAEPIDDASTDTIEGDCHCRTQCACAMVW